MRLSIRNKEVQKKVAMFMLACLIGAMVVALCGCDSASGTAVNVEATGTPATVAEKVIKRFDGEDEDSKCARDYYVETTINRESFRYCYFKSEEKRPYVVVKNDDDYFPDISYTLFASNFIYMNNGAGISGFDHAGSYEDDDLLDDKWYYDDNKTLGYLEIEPVDATQYKIQVKQNSYWDDYYDDYDEDEYYKDEDCFAYLTDIEFSFSTGDTRTGIMFCNAFVNGRCVHTGLPVMVINGKGMCIEEGFISYKKKHKNPVDIRIEPACFAKARKLKKSEYSFTKKNLYLRVPGKDFGICYGRCSRKQCEKDYNYYHCFGIVSKGKGEGLVWDDIWTEDYDAHTKKITDVFYIPVKRKSK